MRIVHTSDWHMGRRQGYVDRTDDLKRCIRQVAGVCREQNADVLLIAGDLFDGSTRPELVRDWMEFLSDTFAPFLVAGGTILAITGNHDNDHLARTLRASMHLAAPSPAEAGDLLPPGRLYLFSGPTFFRLAGRGGHNVQFVAMPSPTVAHYLNKDTARFATGDERDRALKAAFKQRLEAFAGEPAYDTTIPTVLLAHVPVTDARIAHGRTYGDFAGDGVALHSGELPTAYAYVALGDIHQPQALMGLKHVRYCGSVDRMDLGEADDEKGVLVVDVGPLGLRGDPVRAPLDATPVYRVVIDDPPAQLPTLAERHPDRERAVVHLTIRHRPGRDNLPALIAELSALFPRHYARDVTETGDRPAGQAAIVPTAHTLRDTVHDYLNRRLADDPDRDALLSLVDELLADDR